MAPLSSSIYTKICIVTLTDERVLEGMYVARMTKNLLPMMSVVVTN